MGLVAVSRPLLEEVACPNGLGLCCPGSRAVPSAGARAGPSFLGLHYPDPVWRVAALLDMKNSIGDFDYDYEPRWNSQCN